MTEQEWLACADSGPMLEFLWGKASDRKLRLFAVACCRRIRHLMSNDNPERYEVAERFADGQCSTSQLGSAWALSTRLTSSTINNFPIAWNAANYADAAAGDTACTNSHEAAISVCELAQLAVNPIENKYGKADLGEEHYAQAILLKEIFGNPFRPATLDPSWLTPTVRSIADGIYADRAFDRLPILADALQDAGCDSDDILSHCRSEGPHVRGCWVVDLILAKG
jgi:hypothetical protein